MHFFPLFHVLQFFIVYYSSWDKLIEKKVFIIAVITELTVVVTFFRFNNSMTNICT